MTETKRVIAVNTVSQIAAKIASGVSAFGVSILLARALGPVGYGDFTKVTAFISLFYLFADFGLNATYIQGVGLDPKDKSRFPALIALRIVLAAALIAVALVIGFLLPSSAMAGYPWPVKIGMVLFAPTIVFSAIITTMNAAFQSRLRYDLSAVAAIAGALASVVSVAVIVRIAGTSFDLSSSLVTIGIGSLVTAVVSSILVRSLGLLVSPRWNGRTAVHLLSASVPLGLTLVCNTIYFHADSFLLALLRPTAEVGTYGFAYKLFEFILVIPTFFMNAMFPLLAASLARHEHGTFRSRIAKSAVALTVIAFAGGIIGWAVAPSLTIVRADFQGSVALLRILMVGLPVFFLSALSMWTLIALRMRSVMLAIYVISMMCNIAANAYLIPRFGATASAWITVVSEALVCIVSWMVIFPKLPYAQNNVDKGHGLV